MLTFIRNSFIILLFLFSTAKATEVITSDVGSWSSQYGFQSCYGYGGAKPCVSNGSYFSSDGVGSGDVVFAYTSYYIYNTFTMPAGFSGSTMYLSLDMMTGPRNSEQGNKTEYVTITVYQKNSSGTIIQTNTINENITNTTMSTFDYTVSKNVSTSSVEIRISGRDGGYWAGNYGAVIGANTITLNDGATTPADPDKTNFTYWNNHQTRKDTFDNMTTGTDNIVRIDQVGDNTIITITQNKGGYSTKGNKIMGRTSANDTALIYGDNNSIDLEQNGNNIILNLDVNSNHTDIISKQNGDGHRARIIAENGDYNYIYLYQSNTGGEGNFADIRTSGSDNSATAYQYDNNQLLVIDTNGNDDNTITVTQRDGENYASIVTNSDDNTIALTQKGGGDHAVNVITSGNPYTLTITQDSSTSRSFELNSSCSTSGGCSSTVTQN